MQGFAQWVGRLAAAFAAVLAAVWIWQAKPERWTGAQAQEASACEARQRSDRFQALMREGAAAVQRLEARQPPCPARRAAWDGGLLMQALLAAGAAVALLVMSALVPGRGG